MGNIQPTWQDSVDLENKIEAEKQKAGGGNQDLIAQWITEKAELEASIVSNEQAARSEKALEVNNANGDIVQQIFSALLPNTTVFETIMGINEFAEFRTNFYQLGDMALTERTQVDYAQHAEELAQKDERIRALTATLSLTEQQLDKANSIIHDQEVDINHWIEKYNESEQSCVEITDMLNVTKNKLMSAQMQIENLEMELDKLNKAKSVPAAIGGTLQEKLDAIKKKSEISSDEWTIRFNARQKDEAAKLAVAEPQQESPSTDDLASEPASDQLSATYETAPVEAPTFQTIQAPALGNIGLPMADRASDDSGSGEETFATQGWVKEQLARALAEIRGAA